MARIKRYISDKTVQLLRSQQAALMTPAEAARVEQAKFDAIGAGVNLGREIHKQLSETAAKEELSQAVNGLEGDLRVLDTEIDKEPMTVKDDGTIEYNTEEASHNERYRRMELVSERRKHLKSAAAKRAFDEGVARMNFERDADMVIRFDETNRDVSKANGLQQVFSYRRHGQYDLAHSRLQDMVNAGVLTAADFAVEREKTQIARDMGVVEGVLLDPEATDTEIELVIEGLETGTWSPLLGLENPMIEMGNKDKLTMRAALYRHEATIDDRNQARIEMEQESNVVDEMQILSQGDSSPQRIANLPQNFLSLSDRKWLYNKAGDPNVVKSLPSALTEVRNGILDLMTLGATNDKVAQLRAMSRTDDITVDDAMTLYGEIDAAVAMIDNSEADRRILDAELVRLQGLTEQQGYSGTTDDRRSERAAGADMARDFWAAKQAMPEGFDATAWLKDNKTTYYRTALRDMMAEKYGVSVDRLPATRDEAIPLIEGMVYEYGKRAYPNLKDPTEAGVVLYEGEYSLADAVADDMRKVGALMHHAWSGE